MNWSVLMPQLRAVARVELRRYRRGRRWMPPCVLAILPDIVMLVSLLLGADSGPVVGFRRVPIEYARFFQNFWLRFLIFFSCVVLCWETFNYVLPSLFQHLSVTLYLHSFMPVTVLNGPFGITVDPPGPVASAAALMIASTGIVAFTSYLVRYIQITYSTD